ncbi:hypothetical protein DH2020_030405 [Rehmannia glutinosa]|uniref:Uncharacterized protein n=1 Tax=Rehmannia glutinosa TaxID=99300 RepID=A0ABR0VMK7_REHGL
MAGSVEGEGFWLPAEFLTDDDFLMDKDNFEKSNKTGSESEFFFPTVFPHDFETDGDKTHELWVMSTSPQSTLAHLGSWTGRSAGGSSNGSPNGVPSPPTTPLGAEYDAVGDLIYRAAGQVARLKLNRGDGLKQQNEGCGVWYSQQRCTKTGVEGQGEKRVKLHGPSSKTRPVRGRCYWVDLAAVVRRRKGRAGTGVFLPRRYGNHNDSNNYSSNSHKKPDFRAKNFYRHYCFLRRLKEKKPHKPVSDSSTLSSSVHTGGSTALFHAHTNNLNGFAPQSQPRLNTDLFPDYSMCMWISAYAVILNLLMLTYGVIDLLADSLMVRRHAVVLQQRRRLLMSLADRSSMMSRDLYLPQEWTY